MPEDVGACMGVHDLSPLHPKVGGILFGCFFPVELGGEGDFEGPNEGEIIQEQAHDLRRWEACQQLITSCVVPGLRIEVDGGQIARNSIYTPKGGVGIGDRLTSHFRYPGVASLGGFDEDEQDLYEFSRQCEEFV